MLSRAAHARAARQTNPSRSSSTARCATSGPSPARSAELAEAPLPADARPAILVVGRVAALRDHLRWFDVRPLFGRRVVVTRPREQARELVELLEDQGAQVMLRRRPSGWRPATDFTPLDEACANIGEFDWLVLPTLMGTEVFLRRLLAGRHRHPRT